MWIQNLTIKPTSIEIKNLLIAKIIWLQFTQLMCWEINATTVYKLFNKQCKLQIPLHTSIYSKDTSAINEALFTSFIVFLWMGGKRLCIVQICLFFSSGSPGQGKGIQLSICLTFLFEFWFSKMRSIIVLKVYFE